MEKVTARNASTVIKSWTAAHTPRTHCTLSKKC